MKSLEFLTKTAVKIEGQIAEMEQLNQQEPVLRTEIENKVSELAATIPPEKLFSLDGNSPDLDQDTAFAVRTLSGLRMKLELIPNVRVRLKTALEKNQSDARRLADEIADDLREDARLKIEELTIKIYGTVLPICGNDVTRARTATKAVTDASELTKWLKGFDSLIGRASPSDLRVFRKYALAYTAGKTIAEVK